MKHFYFNIFCILFKNNKMTIYVWSTFCSYTICIQHVWETIKWVIEFCPFFMDFLQNLINFITQQKAQTHTNKHAHKSRHNPSACLMPLFDLLIFP